MGDRLTGGRIDSEESPLTWVIDGTSQLDMTEMSRTFGHSLTASLAARVPVDRCVPQWMSDVYAFLYGMVGTYCPS